MLWQRAQLPGKHGSSVLIFTVQLERLSSKISKTAALLFLTVYSKSMKWKRSNGSFKQTEDLIWEFLNIYILLKILKGTVVNLWPATRSKGWWSHL